MCWGGARQARGARGVRHRLSDARRDGDSGLCPRRRYRRRASASAGRGARWWRHGRIESGHWHGPLRPRGRGGGAPRDWASGADGRAAAPAGRSARVGRGSGACGDAARMACRAFESGGNPEQRVALASGTPAGISRRLSALSGPRGDPHDAVGAGTHVQPRNAIRAGRARRLFTRLMVSDRSEVVAIPPDATARRPLSRRSGEGAAPRGGVSRRHAAAGVPVQPAAARGRPLLFRAETGKPEGFGGTDQPGGWSGRGIRHAHANAARSVSHGTREGSRGGAGHGRALHPVARDVWVGQPTARPAGHGARRHGRVHRDRGRWLGEHHGRRARRRGGVGHHRRGPGGGSAGGHVLQPLRQSSGAVRRRARGLRAGDRRHAGPGRTDLMAGLLGGGGGGLRGHGELPLNADINVTSLVDVAFVLLIIFMITAPIMQGGVDVRLPRAEARPLEPKSGLVVTLDREGRIFMDQAPLSYADFRATFPAFVRTKRPTGVYLRADGRVPYAEVVQVLAVIRAAGVNDVGLVAEPEGAAP